MRGEIGRKLAGRKEGKIRMKVIIAGGRDFKGTAKSLASLIHYMCRLPITEVVCGMARGADTYGYDFAKKFKIPIKEFKPDWNKFGKSAGYRRNQEMGEYADYAILFPGGKGTAHMKNIMIKLGKPYVEIN